MTAAPPSRSKPSAPSTPVPHAGLAGSAREAIQAPWRGVLAAVDMGSNSFRLELGHWSRGSYRRIDYLKETVRLGAGLDAQSRLTEEAAQRGLACLARFRARLNGIPPRQLRAVATQTLREATNRNEFLERAQAVLGHPIEVISGREEARLIYKGVARLQPSDRQRLVIDIGGRSTEMIIGTGTLPQRTESFQVGSVSLSQRYFPQGRFDEEAFRAAQVAAGAELEEALTPFAPDQWDEALGSSGTVGAVSAILQAAGITDGTITPEGLRWCMRECLAAGTAERLLLPGLKPERRAVLGGGLSILYTLAMNFGVTALQPARGALRQGVIFDLQERLAAERRADHHDMRDDTVAELQHRFDADIAQAQRVRETALSLHDDVVATRLATATLEARRELGWAAALHEIGMMVSHHDHHRHSAYLVGHVDAPGFSQSQQRQLAELVLGQRGGLRKIEASLQTQPGLAWQVLCLRLAVILCHARSDMPRHTVRLNATYERARLRFSPGWAAAHPRTLHLLDEETLAWSRSPHLRLQLDPDGS